MTINAPKYQPCPECGARCKRISKNELTMMAFYEHKGCKKVGTSVKWNVALGRKKRRG